MYLRCPGCSHEGRLVGTTFEAPPHKDSKGWQIVAQKLDAGERFLPCPSQAQHEELMAEGRRMMERKARRAEWEMERSRRIAALKSGSLARSSDEGLLNEEDNWDIISQASSWSEVSEAQ